MKELVLGVWLAVLSIFDLKYKEIPLSISILGGVIGIGFCLVEPRALISVLVSCLPGFLALLFACISKEVMGYGDGMILIGMGMYLPISQLLSIGLQAFTIAGIVALGLLVLFRKKGNYRLPLIPFLGLAYGWECFVQWGKL